MKALKAHLARHWPKHVSVLSIAVIVLSFTIGAAAPVIYHHVHGGLQRGPLPPAVQIGGGYVPPAYYLTGSIVRVHNQGNSNSCVGQTLSTILEIETHEFAQNHPVFASKHPYFRANTAFSAGFIWNQATGGQNLPTTYNAAFQVFQGQGDAPLSLFPPDGATGWGELPDSTATRYAHYHRIVQWNSIDPSDRHTVEEEIVHGRPVAMAIPVYDSFYQNWNGTWPVITENTGQFWFWHSVTIVGYNQTGVVILNSWGPNWGYHGRATVAWSLIAADNAGLVAQVPHWPNTTPKPPNTKGRSTKPVYVPTARPVPTNTPRPTATATSTPRPTATTIVRTVAPRPPAGHAKHHTRTNPNAPATPVPAGHVPNP